MLVLEEQGGENFFGEPALKISDFMRTERNGRGFINILAADDYKLDAISDILKAKMVRRGLSAKALDFGKKEPASHGAQRQRVAIQQGISKEKAKEVVKAIKDSKLKVQAQIMDDQVRVSGKKIDDLQSVIQLLKGKDFDIDMQYVNMRS